MMMTMTCDDVICTMTSVSSWFEIILINCDFYLMAILADYPLVNLCHILCAWSISELISEID